MSWRNDRSIAEADVYRILFNDIDSDEEDFEELNIVSTGSGTVNGAIDSDEEEDQSKKQTSYRSNNDEDNFLLFS